MHARMKQTGPPATTSLGPAHCRRSPSYYTKIIWTILCVNNNVHFIYQTLNSDEKYNCNDIIAVKLCYRWWVGTGKQLSHA